MQSRASSPTIMAIPANAPIAIPAMAPPEMPEELVDEMLLFEPDPPPPPGAGVTGVMGVPAVGEALPPDDNPLPVDGTTAAVFSCPLEV